MPPIGAGGDAANRSTVPAQLSLPMKLFRILVPALAAALLGSGCASLQASRSSYWYEFNPWDVQPTARVVAHGPYKLFERGHAYLKTPDDESLYWNDRVRRIVSTKSGVPEDSLDLDYLLWFYLDWQIGGSVTEKKTLKTRWDEEAPGRIIAIAEPYEDADRQLWRPLKLPYAIFDGDRKKKVVFRYFLDYSCCREDSKLVRVVAFLLDGEYRPIRKASGWIANRSFVDANSVPETEVEAPRHNWSYRTVRMPDGNRQMWLPAGELIGGVGVPEVGALIVKMLNDMSDEELDALEDVEP